MINRKVVYIGRFIVIGVIGTCLFYNIFTLFFPISIGLAHDEAEHLHVAYILSYGEKPFVDFIENHPTLFNHYLKWLHEFFDISSSHNLAIWARGTILFHFVLCFIVFCLWASRLIVTRPIAWNWIGILLIPWIMIDLYHPHLYPMWQIRPDFICYAYTFWGCYLVYLWLKNHYNQTSHYSVLMLVAGGVLIGFGNAILPKGTIILIALVLAFITAKLIQGRKSYSFWNNRSKFKGLGIAGLSAFLTFIVSMLLDCYLSQIDPAKWIKAVFLLNTQKHIVFTQAEVNPVTSIVDIFSIPFIFALVFIVWIIWEVSNLSLLDKEREGERYLWLFAIFIILINLMSGTYSNGATFSHNFIPSIFAVASIYLFLLLRVRQVWQKKLTYKLLRPQLIGVATVLAFAITHVLLDPVESILRYQHREDDRREIKMMTSTDFVRDELLPNSFVYFAPYIQYAPVKAHHWGYYFMLSDNQGFWEDCYQLGLSPNPKKVWANGFGKNPPDALAFLDPIIDPVNVQRFISMLWDCQGINANWISEEIKEHYIPMRCRWLFLYVRHDKVTYLEERGWRIDLSEMVSKKI